jgi:prolyl oligopeptidase
MDGVQHVVNGTQYPAVICVGGRNDRRVTVWIAGKFAAALQNASTSGKPVLMKVNYDNGHITEDRSVAMVVFLMVPMYQSSVYLPISHSE